MNAVEVSATNLNEIKVEKMWNWVLLRNSWCYRNLRMRIFGCSFVRQPKSKRERVYSSIKYMHLLCFFVGCSELCQRNITFYDHSYAIRTWAMCVCVCVVYSPFRFDLYRVSCSVFIIQVVTRAQSGKMLTMPFKVWASERENEKDGE